MDPAPPLKPPPFAACTFPEFYRRSAEQNSVFLHATPSVSLRVQKSRQPTELTVQNTDISRIPIARASTLHL